MSSQTRSMISCSIFGPPCEFPANQLPTYGDIMRQYKLIRNLLKENYNNKEPSVKEVSNAVAAKVESIWLKSSLPITTHTRVVQMVQQHHEKYIRIKKSSKSKKNLKSYQLQVRKFECHSSKLFDICSCKCIDLNECKCPRDRKVSLKERGFLLDQRSQRLMYIGNIDYTETKKLQKRVERRKKALHSTNSSIGDLSLVREYKELNETFEYGEEYEDGSVSENEDEHGERSQKYSKCTQSKQLRRDLPTVALTCDRYGVSDRSAAAIASAVLQDFGLINTEQSMNVVDRSKVRRDRNKMKAEMKKQVERKPFMALFFDGRKDKTLKMCPQKRRRMSIVEEHISIIGEPNSQYIGHVTPTSGTGKSICTVILEFYNDENIPLDSLDGIGCDGTAVNTGKNGGVVRLIEMKIGRSLQWIVCMLHANELLLHHIFQCIDGKTSGPNAY